MLSPNHAPAQPAVREGAIADIGDALDRLGAGRVLAVLDQAAYRGSGAADIVEPHLAVRHTSRFVGFEANPKIGDVERGVVMFRSLRPDVVVAIGGGTALDLAKLIGAIGVHGAPVRAYATGAVGFDRPGPPVIAVPTTAGTGSEATHFAVVYVDGVKHSVADSRLRPQEVILDPRLTYTLPASLTAVSGLDALCQGIESMWAVGATAESLEHAAEAVRLAVAHLHEAVVAPTPAARSAMMRAAHHSGRAIDISTTTAPHALSYTLSNRFGLPHGAAVALLLGAFLEFNAGVEDEDCVDPSGAEQVRGRVAEVMTALGASSPSEARSNFEHLVRAVGCPTGFRQAGLDEDVVPALVEGVNLQRLANNPRKIEPGTLVDLLHAIL